MIERIGDITLIRLSELDSNIYVIGDTIIDSGTGFNFTRLYGMLKSMGKPVDSIKYVINTHYHFDHVGGNGYFLNAQVAIHEKDASVLESGDSKTAMADYFDGKLKPRKPDILLKDGQKLKIGNWNFEVIHTPGHTPGSICLFEPKKAILISGDTVFADGVGRTDIPGGDQRALFNSIQNLIKLKPKVLLPGHGKIITSDAVKILQKINTERDSI
ncbi:MAG: MBL fold metallo-hydrolase [Candidatus Aenigmatarchaeota archaeon]